MYAAEKHSFSSNISSFYLLALQDMLPTLMSQMGLGADGPFGGKAGEGQAETGNEQGAAGDDEVPGKIHSNVCFFFDCLFFFFFFSDLVKNFDDASNKK